MPDESHEAAIARLDEADQRIMARLALAGYQFLSHEPVATDLNRWWTVKWGHIVVPLTGGAELHMVISNTLWHAQHNGIVL